MLFLECHTHARAHACSPLDPSTDLALACGLDPSPYLSPLNIASKTQPALARAVAQREALLRELFARGVEAGTALFKHTLALALADKVCVRRALVCLYLLC